MLIYKLQRVARHKSHSPALTCSMCHFGMKIGVKFVDFCHFYIINLQKNTYKPVIIFEYSSGDTQMSKNAILKTLVHDFSEGV